MTSQPSASSRPLTRVGEDGAPPMMSSLKAGEVVLRSIGVVKDRVEDGRYREDARDAVLLDSRHQRPRFEPPQHDVGAADHRQEVRRSPAVDVEERDHVQNDVVLIEVDADLSVDRVQVELSMRHRDALGEAGRAARVEQLGHRVLVDLGTESVGGAGREQVFVLVRGDPAGLAFHDHEPRRILQLAGDLFDERLEVAMEEEDLGSRVADDVGDLAGRQADIDRVQDRARLEDAEIGLEQLVRVVGDEAHPIAGLDADPHERVREPMRSLAELPIRQPDVAVDDAHLVSEEGLGPIAELQHGQRNEHHNLLAGRGRLPRRIHGPSRTRDGCPTGVGSFMTGKDTLGESFPIAARAGVPVARSGRGRRGPAPLIPTAQLRRTR